MNYHQYIPQGILHLVSIVVWILFTINLVVGFYVTWYLPHGPLFDTGQTVCENYDMGPCDNLYKEDMSGLHIPTWAKFMRQNEILFFLVLGGLGVYLSTKANEKV